MTPDSAEQLRRLQEEIAALRQAIDALAALPVMQQTLLEQLATKQRELAAVQAPPLVSLGTDNVVSLAGDIVGGDKVTGDKIISLGTLIYGRNPEADERRRLQWYLERLANKLYRLPLRGLDEQLDRGQGIALPKVYVGLATTAHKWIARFSRVGLQWKDRSAPAEPCPYWADEQPGRSLLPVYDPEYALPDIAITLTEYRSEWDWTQEIDHDIYDFHRSQLAVEAVREWPHLVLLGDPGSGKSTFVRYLAWTLARRSLGQLDDTTALFGWDDGQTYLPIMLPLRSLAGRIARDGSGYKTVYNALCAEIADFGVDKAGDMLNAALHTDAALVLFDGLDEVSLDASPQSADRLTTLRAVRDFVQAHARSRAVLTCRAHGFDQELQHELGWASATVAPFTLGQARHFLPAFYGELAAKGRLDAAQAERLAADLIAAIERDPKLRELATTPLLLTLMALVLYNKGELPRDRPQLYERVLELLLGQWDKLREGQSLGEALGLPEFGPERIRPLLDRLSYQAHLDAASEDGRGRLERGKLRDALIEFFGQAGLREPWALAGRCLDYINQRSGLLVPDDAQASYVFAHLTLQEHCAGRALVTSKDAVDRLLRQRADDRWREPILLGLGVVQPSNPWLIESLLRRLIDRDEDAHPKTAERWQRDLLFAAEIGQDRDWAFLREQGLDVAALQRDLRHGLVVLLDDAAQPLPLSERIRAAGYLGALGDPRFPTTVDSWRTTVEHALGVAPASHSSLITRHSSLERYWCYVPPGSYRIGGWQDGQATTTVELPAFWLARLPISVAQFAPFAEEGYSEGAERWWTVEGWRWRSKKIRELRLRRREILSNEPNLPLTGISWYEATAFCAWQSEQLADVLPAGYVLRLPTEAEWEVAAAYDKQLQRHHYPWGEAKPVAERAIYDDGQHSRPAPVGTCPAGAASCGALDLAGNVWEWMANTYHNYPRRAGTLERDFSESRRECALRGGGWRGSAQALECGTRIAFPPVISDDGFGLRVVLAPIAP